MPVLSDAEVGTRLSRCVLSHDEGEEARRVHRYKTFLQRTIGGVPMGGHRAVFSHNADGSFSRALVVWRAVITERTRVHCVSQSCEEDSEAHEVDVDVDSE